MNHDRSNLLFVFSDQQSFDMLRCAGNPQIKTPNLDAFAREGTRFEHAVANCPVCTPCRSMLLSGRHPLHNNCFENDRRLLHRDEIGPGFGHVLGDASYRMGYVGKWHLYGGDRNRPIPAGPDRQGFDAPEAFKALYNEDEIVPRGQLPNTAENRRMTLGYYAMCSEVDHHFGRLMSKLQEKGFADNTLVVFASDHGENFGAHAAQCHKGNPEDVSVRIPLLMRLPGVIPADHISQLLIGMLDVPPSLLGLMGQAVPSNWAGLNLSEAICNKNDNAVDRVPIFNFKPSWRGVYTRRYTFAMENIERTPDMHTRFGSDLPDQRKIVQNFNVLYNREVDPLQLNNLINASDHLDKIWELTQLTHAWCAQFNDPFLSYNRLIERVGDGDGMDRH